MAQFCDTFLYMHVDADTMRCLFEILEPNISVRDKSALTIVCENLLQWAAFEAARGKLVSKLGKGADKYDPLLKVQKGVKKNDN